MENHLMLIDKMFSEYNIDNNNTTENAKKIAYYYNNYIAYILSEQQTFYKNLSECNNNNDITKLIKDKYMEVQKMDNFENFSKPFPVSQDYQAAQPAKTVQDPQVLPAPTVGGRRNSLKHADISMKYIKSLCKANQIKLSTTINDKRVTYTKKELITKLKRKKLL